MILKKAKKKRVGTISFSEVKYAGQIEIFFLVSKSGLEFLRYPKQFLGRKVPSKKIISIVGRDNWERWRVWSVHRTFCGLKISM